MADMANLEQVEDAREELTDVVPIAYMNSSAAIKAFVGRHSGAVCTSTNTRVILEWALQRGNKALFFPDQHLERNTAPAMGYGHHDTAIWNHIATSAGSPNRPCSMRLSSCGAGTTPSRPCQRSRPVPSSMSPPKCIS
ncbi:MAG: quinolinate synthase NadA [Acidimicrobiales bacterium]|jgi:quinolinate synthase